MITALAEMSIIIRRQSSLYEFSIVGLMLQDKSPVHQSSCACAYFSTYLTPPQLSKRLKYMLVAWRGLNLLILIRFTSRLKFFPELRPVKYSALKQEALNENLTAYSDYQINMKYYFVFLHALYALGI